MVDILQATALPYAVSGVAFLALVAWLLYKDLGSRLHQSFALLLFLRGLDLLIFSTSIRRGEPLFNVWSYVVVASPFAALYFGYTFRRLYRRGAEAGHALLSALFPWLLLAFATITEVAYFLDHGLLAAPGRVGPLVVFLWLRWFAMGCVALLLGFDALKASTPGAKRGLFLLASGMILHPLYQALTDLFLFIQFYEQAVTGWEPVTNVVAAILLLFGVVVWLIGVHRTSPAQEGLPRAWVRRLDWGLGVVLGLAFLFIAANVSRWVETIVVSRPATAALALAFPAFAWIAIARHSVLEVDVMVRKAVARGTLSAVLLASVLLASEAVQALAEAGLPGIDPRYAPFVGVGAGGILLLFYQPLKQRADRWAKAATANARPAAELTANERLDVYREQVQLAWLDGRLERKERLLLDRLRERLGIPLDEAVELESEAVRRASTPRRPKKPTLRPTSP
ncbi:MAG: hypothetical protein HYT80_08265 [Euryarchaeota archaeon]|nr:hypothetical protein [Euryarchaeota archaeon]